MWNHVDVDAEQQVSVETVAALRGQCAQLIDVLFVGAECAATGLKALQRACSDLLADLRLADITVELRGESSPVLTLACKSTVVFDYFLAELNTSTANSRLQQALLANKIEAVLLYCQKPHKVVAIRLAPASSSGCVEHRRREMRKLLSPLFEGRGRSIIPSHMLSEFSILLQDSSRLRETLQGVNWLFDETTDNLVLQPR